MLVSRRRQICTAARANTLTQLTSGGFVGPNSIIFEHTNPEPKFDTILNLNPKP